MLRALQAWRFPSRLPAGLRLLLAVFYLTLGVSAAWHAPHFSRGELAIGNDRHQHHEAVNSETCALCTVQKAPHQVASSPAPFLGTSFAVFAHAVPASRLPANFVAALPRGPPARLS